MTVKRSNMFHITRIKKYRFGKCQTENTKRKENHLNLSFECLILICPERFRMGYIYVKSSMLYVANIMIIKSLFLCSYV